MRTRSLLGFSIRSVCNERAEQNHWSERGRATPVGNADPLGRPRRSVLELGKSCQMTKTKELLHSYGYAVVLSLMFQVSAWAMCFVNGSMYAPAEINGAVLLNWRVWLISCGLYWLGFLGVFLPQRQNPTVWRVLYAGLGFPVLFAAAALLVPRMYKAPAPTRRAFGLRVLWLTSSV
jgi:hypothetical protein